MRQEIQRLRAKLHRGNRIISWLIIAQAVLSVLTMLLVIFK